MRKILTYPHSLLCENSEPVTEITDEMRELADEMATIMYENQGIGLAAPQIGECIRLVVIDLSGPEERTDLQVLVNPEIVARSGEDIATEEGCLSLTGYRAKVKRSDSVTVKATNLDGQVICR